MKLILPIIISILIFVFVCSISSVLVFFLWNEIMPVIFDLPTISFWQAYGLTLLCKLLFGNTHNQDKKDSK